MATLIGAGSHARDIAATEEFARTFAHHSKFTDDGGRVVIGINDPRLRARVAYELKIADGKWVHPRAWVGPDVNIGHGTHINYLAALTRTMVGPHTTISPGAVICGDVAIGRRVLIGAGAVICDRVTIEDDVTVAAGAVVPPCSVLERGRTYRGVPAR